MKEKTCEICDKRFIPKANTVGRFCSISCTGKGRTTQSKVDPFISMERFEYNLSPKKCRFCSSQLSYEKRKNLFCNSSCSASYNNKFISKKSKLKRKNTYKNKANIKYTHTTLSISKITGKLYNSKYHSGTWHDNNRYKSALRLSQMFNFKLGTPTTEANIIESIEKITHMYHIERISPFAIQKLFNNTDKSNFTTWFSLIGIEKQEYIEKTHWKGKPRIKNECGIFWSTYRRKSTFSFSDDQIRRINGYDLFIKNGIYNHRDNPNGVVKDHMVSKKFGFDNNIDPQIIGHPANCEFLTNSDNCRKNYYCSITLEELMRRIELWRF